MTGISSAYLAMADVESHVQPRYTMGLFDERAAALRCFQRYSKNATRDITDGQGLSRWVTQKQARVYGIIARIALSPSGAATMTAIAQEAMTTTSTVSRTIHKLEAWEMYAVEIRRGKYGGITVHRKGWDRFFDYVHEARRRISEARIRARSKVASIIRGGRGTANGRVPDTSTVMVATLDRQHLSFAERVLYERAMLALEDPEGEYEAKRPLIGPDAVDEALQQAQDERRRRLAAIREAALAGDWDKWEELRRWDEG